MTELRLADGQRVVVTTAGSGPDLVCVPGGPARAGAYLGDLGGLTDACTLHVLDQRGSGGSRPADPETLTVDRLAADLLEVVALLGLHRPAVLSHSFGARVVARALEQQPDLASALVFVTPGPLVADPSVFAPARAAILALRDDLPDAVEAARAQETARPRDRAMLEEMSIPLWYGSWGPAQQAHAASQREQTDTRTALTLRAAGRYYTDADLSAVTAPALVVAGSLDLLSPPPVAHAVHDLLAASTYAEIDGAGHFPWVDEPELFAGLVADWLAGRDLAGDEG